MDLFAIILCLLAGSAAAPAAAHDPGAAQAAEFLGAAEEARSPDLDYAVDFSLHVSDPNTVWKERTAHYTMIAHGKDHSLIVLREPRQFHPGTLLIMDGLYWMLFPRTNRPIQLSARNVLDGDVANGDLARGNLLRHYGARLDGEEEIRGEPCRVFELVRRSLAGSYPRIRYAASKTRPRPVRLEYYGETGKLDRTVWYEDYRDTAIGTRATKIVVASGRRPGEVSTMTFTDLRAIDVSGLTFDIPGLIAYRDAARSRYDADGRQARPEDVVALVRAAVP